MTTIGGHNIERYARERLQDEDFTFALGTKPGRRYPNGTSLDWVGTWTDQGTVKMRPRFWKRLGTKLYEKHSVRELPKLLRKHLSSVKLKRALMVLVGDRAMVEAINRKGLVDTGFMRANSGAFDATRN